MVSETKETFDTTEYRSACLMPSFETLHEGLLARDLYATQDHFENRDENLRVIAKLKVPGGIKQGIWWQSIGERRPAREEEVRKKVQTFEYVSKRPFMPGDPCDGTRDSCVWGCLWDAVRRSEAEAEGFLRAINEAYGETRVTRDMQRVTVQKAGWEGIYVPRVWTEAWARRLVESVRAINWSTLASMIENKEPGGCRAPVTWLDVLTEERSDREAA